jgi:teichuronic acid biosynthesis glycosyltransferase TuaH
LTELVVCSLEAWDDVWRRNQFLTDILLRRHPRLRILFVEPPADPLFDIWNRRLPAMPRLRVIGYEGRLRALRPLKVLPRRAGQGVDTFLRRQVLFVANRLRLARPTLWINDVTYAPLIGATGWPSLYDVTDDWLTAPSPSRELDRIANLDRIALDRAGVVVVCSPSLAASRGRHRDVFVIPNAVDVGHFRRLRPRPRDLPESPTAVYVGSLHTSRFDVDLVVELARALPSLSIVLVGPDSLDGRARARLDAERNITRLGVRPYDSVPAYLQHADVIVVPHLVNDFTESLDPIKAYECLVARSPTVATPVAGFRELNALLRVARVDEFCSAVRSVLEAGWIDPEAHVPTWDDRADDFEQVLRMAGPQGLGQREQGLLRGAPAASSSGPEAT